MVFNCAITSHEYLSSAAYIPKEEISKKNPSHAKDLLTLKCFLCLSRDNLSSHKVILCSCHVHDHTSLPVLLLFLPCTIKCTFCLIREVLICVSSRSMILRVL